MGRLAARSQEVVYIAGPYTAPDAFQIAEHINAALVVGKAVERLGQVALIPHIAAGDFFCFVARSQDGERCPALYSLETPWETAMDRCRALLPLCAAVVMVEGWEHSRGACEEKALAEALGIPVFLGAQQLAQAQEVAHA
jgi:hypothetical protein